jgi:hypothetical protein
MPTPSLILVPARFKTGKLYTPVATTSGGLVLGASGDFNVTRATTATRVNASGLIESVASGIPRLDYFASGGVVGCPALLVEPQSQNVARFVNQMTGQDFPSASGGLTITTGSTDFLAPNGASGSITKYVGGAASGDTQQAYYVGGSITASASGVHTFSLFVKAGATNPLNFCAIQFALFTGASGTATSYFSLASGTALTTGASIQNYGNGWYRLTSAPYTIAAGDLTGNVVFIFAEANNDFSWPASGALNLTAYTWGAQMEAGSIATSYIPTTTAAVTRNADVISVSGAVSGCIGQTEGTIYWEGYFGNAQGALAQDGFQIGNNANNYIYFGVNSGRPYFRLRANGINEVTISPIGNVIQNNQKTKIAIAYKSGDSALFVNGTQIGVTDTDAFTFTSSLSVVEIGSSLSSSGSEGFSNSPKKPESFALYTTRLTDSQLAALTTL